MTSSGTSLGKGFQEFTQIKKHQETKQKYWLKSCLSLLGNQRLPMIIVDTPNILRDRNCFPAQGWHGFSMFGSKKMYALDDQMRLNIDEVLAFFRIT